MNSGRKVVVKASAGSGKTTTLVRAYLQKFREVQGSFHDGRPYEHLLALTFTNEAAYKLRKDIFNETGDEQALLTENISTIHSYCNYIVRENAFELGIPPDYSIFEDEEGESFADRILQGILHDFAGKDVMLRKFLSEYSVEAREHVANSGFKGMILAIYEWMRTEVSTLEEGIKALKDAERGFESWLTDRFGREVNVQKYLEKHRSDVDTLLRYTAIFWERRESAIKRSGKMGYSDIIYYAHSLLARSAAIRNRIRRSLHCVLVDEFQDTDKLQLEIINMISEKEKQFFVGDPQQLIYEWRKADPGIFAEQENSMIDDSGSAIVYLNENFRSAPGIVNFTNLLFGEINNSLSMEYIRMDAVLGSEDKALGTECGDVTFFLLPRGSKEEMRRDEAEAIAEEIMRAVTADAPGGSHGEGKGRSARYSDMAILFRSRNSMKVYEEALKQAHIPYIHFQSRQFFEKPEVVMMMSLLKFIERPEDPLNIIAVLRSPFFEVSDDTIVQLFRNGSGIQSVVSQASPVKDSGLLRFRSFIEWMNANGSLAVSEKILHAVRESAFDLMGLAGTEAKQAYANIFRFIDMVREVERRAGPGGSLAKTLNAMAERGETAEAQLFDSGSNAVRLMTVHAAKGLEFPYVFIADSFRQKSNGTTALVIHRRLGVVLTGVDDGVNPHYELQEKIAGEMRKEERERAAREESRIFYVAVTRAMKRLYLGIPAAKAPAGSWAGMIDNFLRKRGLDAMSLSDGIRDIGNTAVRTMVFRRNRSPGKVAGDEETLPLPSLNESAINLDLETLRRGERVYLSPSKIALFLSCPQKLLLSEHRAGMKSNDGRYEGMERGTLIHLWLENYDYMTGNVPAYVRSLCGEQYSDVEKSALRFVNSEIGKRASRAAAEGRLLREMKFASRYGNAILNGKIDLIIEGERGRTIIDYKSGMSTGRDEENRYQLMLYAAALYRISGKGETDLVNFFVDREDAPLTMHVEAYQVEEFERHLEDALRSYCLGRFEALPSRERCSACNFSDECSFRHPGI